MDENGIGVCAGCGDEVEIYKDGYCLYCYEENEGEA